MSAMSGPPTSTRLVRVDVDVSELPLTPGEDGVVTVELTNLAPVISGYRLELLGLDPSCATLPTEVVELFPDERRALTVVFSLPPEFPAGRRRVGLAVVDTATDEVRASASVDLVMTGQSQLQLTAEPSSVEAGASATYVLTAINTGNTVVDPRFVGQDPERAVEMVFDPPAPRLAPGDRAQVTATATAKRPWFGMPLVRLIDVRVAAADAEAMSTVVFLQRPRVSRRAIALAGLLAVVTLFAFVILFSFQHVADRAEANQELLRQGLGEDDALAARATSSSVSGSVTSATGAPVDGAAVALFAPDNPLVPVHSSVTTASGGFRFAAVAAGDYLVRVQAAGFGEVWYPNGRTFADVDPVTVESGADLDGLAIALEGSPGTVGGVVLGDEVEGAIVSVRLPAETFEGQDAEPTPTEVASVAVDATGQFVLPDLPTPATYEIAVDKEGFATQTAIVNLDAGEARDDIELVLRVGDGVIAGSVVGRDGGPVPNATVSVTDGTNSVSTRTLSGGGGTGTFELRDLPTPGTYSVEVGAEGHGSESLTVALEEGQQVEDLRVVLTASVGALSGTVTSTGGVPLGGVQVAVEGGDVTRSTTSLSMGEPGRWTVQRLPVPGEYTLRFSAPGYVTQATSVELLAGPDAVRDDLSVQLVPAHASVSGRVMDTDGTPIGGVAITLTGQGVERRTVSSDRPPGEYRFSTLPPGAYTITYARPGSRPQTQLVDLSAGESFPAPDVVLEAQAGIVGTVTRDGVGESGIDVVVHRAEGYPADEVAATTTGAGGRFEVTALDGPAEYIVEFQDTDGSVLASRSVFLESGEVVELTVDL